MSEVQKVIKYLSIVFAVLLIFNIFSIIFYCFNSLSDVFYGDVKVVDKLKDIDVKGSSILSVDINTANLTIKYGDVLKVETDNKNVDVVQENDKIYVKENGNWFRFNKGANVVITVPKLFVFDGVAIDAVVGNLDISDLVVNNLYLDLGAGKSSINNLNVNKLAEIDSGVGEASLKTSVINNLDIDMGVGNVYLNAQLLGNNKIDTGVGKVDIDLVGTIDDYSISLDKGIGDVNIDGKSIVSEAYGSGVNKINIDAGVGSVDVSLKN